ncbi:MAG TPA: hypothetical protein DEQ38_07260 [Elusimicrobia bacterium]|nr:hypothetical protein [Elusimicrobiota bacterium]
MKRGMLILTLVSAALTGGVSGLCAEGRIDPSYMPASYYGDNDLRDFYQASQMMRRLSESTVSLFSPRALRLDAATGNYTISPQTLQGKFNLQSGEAFADQPVGAYCSGVLVGEDLVLTAGHCFAPHPKGGPCGQVKLVFGYALTRAGAPVTSFPAENVYECGSIIAQRVQEQDEKTGAGLNFACRGTDCRNAPLNGNGPDFALIRLKKKVTGRTPLAISRTAIAPGASVGAIGYPSGMPVKIQETGSSVRAVRGSYFVADLDTFAGNSGSPVFNLETFKIEGILVRGGVDYVYTLRSSTGTTVEDPRHPTSSDYNPGRANVYEQNGGRGEDVTLISEVQALIPRTEMETAMDAARQPTSSRQAQPRVVPAIYLPGDTGVRVQPAVYTLPEPPAPEILSI